MQNANVKSLKRFIFALREFDWQLTRLFARSTPEKQLSTKFHSQMYFAFQVRFRDARIRKDLLEIFWYSIFVSSRKVLRNSRFEKLVRVESSNRSSSNVESWERKKKKKKEKFFSILPTLGFAANLVSISGKRIFSRIFRETRLLRIIQTNHGWFRVWGSTSCCPPNIGPSRFIHLL